MGAETFIDREFGDTAKEAFYRAVKRAQYDHGHSGYTGTIAEKRDFVLIPLPAGKDPEEYASELIDASDPRIDDKWGPAGCIPGSKPDEWIFFGWASS